MDIELQNKLDRIFKSKAMKQAIGAAVRPGLELNVEVDWDTRTLIVTNPEEPGVLEFDIDWMMTEILKMRAH